MKWDAPLSLEAVRDALCYACDKKKFQRGDPVAITINCCPDLQSYAEDICEAVEAIPSVPSDAPRIRWQVHVYNGKPRDWWSLGFIYRDNSGERPSNSAPTQHARPIASSRQRQGSGTAKAETRNSTSAKTSRMSCSMTTACADSSLESVQD